MKRRRGRARGDLLTCRVCGVPLYRLDGDTLYRHAHDAHMLRAPAAWSFFADTLQDFRARGARWVVVTNADNGTTWRAAAGEFDRHGIHDLRRGAFGAQVALPLTYWTGTARHAAGANVQQQDRQLRLMD